MKTILIVDDNRVVVGAYSGLLKSSGFNVVSACDGEAALEQARRERPDGVLLDLQLPKKSGVDVLKALRAEAELRSIPVVVFTQSYMPALADEAWNAGATNVVAKAMRTPRQIVEEVKGLVGQAAD